MYICRWIVVRNRIVKLEEILNLNFKISVVYKESNELF